MASGVPDSTIRSTQIWRVMRRRTLGLRWTPENPPEPPSARIARIEVDGVVVQLAMLLDGSCIAGGLIPYARYELRLENENDEQVAITTADDGTFVVSDPPEGRLRIHIDAARRSHWIER